MKIVTFGEIMMRLQPPSCDRFLNTKLLEMTFGGGEANVAVCLSNLGMSAEFVTKLPDNDLAKACVGELKRWGVKTDNIAIGGERLGVYFCEKGYSQRPSKVIYDRAHSSIATAKVGDINWEQVFADCKWYHFTGITPALSDSACNLLEESLIFAKQKGIKVSCDLNYRKKLWTKQKAQQVMSHLMQYVDVLIANEEDAKDVFGIVADNTDIQSGSISVDGYKSVINQINAKFKINNIAITLRESFNANHNGWSALYYDNGQFYLSDRYDVQVLDRVGAGDSFGAGLIYGCLNKYNSQDAINFAVACSCLKHSINGDFNIVCKAEVDALMKNGGSGRVDR